MTFTLQTFQFSHADVEMAQVIQKLNHLETESILDIETPFFRRTVLCDTLPRLSQTLNE